ncbi:MAG: hypothetical protein M9932_01825 [Xanthobacteraceae bacterium]|nr:hypothetical protein [Xanthobacteraceae bacterium]
MSTKQNPSSGVEDGSVSDSQRCGDEFETDTPNAFHAQVRESQKALCFRWDMRRLYEPLRLELGFDRPMAAIAIALVVNDDWTSYSRRKGWYPGRASRYAEPMMTYASVVGGIDRLDVAGLIDNRITEPGKRGWQSSAIARPALIEPVRAIIRNEPRLIIAAPRETIILRNGDGDNIDYLDSRAIDRMRRRLAQINEAVSSIDISNNAAAPLVRIFNLNFNRGGRFYAMGGAYQSMRKQARKALTINGESVVELDFKTLHPALLYAEIGAPLPADSYDIPPWPRDLVKVALLIIINADSLHTARAAIAWNDAIAAADYDVGSQDAHRTADALIGAIKRAHRPIARFFHGDAGARLMAIDASIAETVQLLMLKRGIVVLPVHDSFLVPASKAAELEDSMVQAAYQIARLAAKIEVA